MPAISRLHKIIALTALFIAATGCASGARTTVRTTKCNEWPESFGRTAVIKVTEPAEKRAACADFAWGRHDTVGGAQRFAEALAVAAREQGNMDIADVWDARDIIAEAGIEPTLCPTPTQADEIVKTLKCTSYIDAEILDWGYSYFLFSSKAYLSCRLTCHDAATHAAYWTLEVDVVGRGMTDYEIVPAAMRAAFRRLRHEHAIATFAGDAK